MSVTNSSQRGFFITGTDTDVGKTHVSASLLRALLDAKQNALAIKPVQTGCLQSSDGLLAEDVQQYARFSEPFFPHGYPDTCCHKFIPACSPHLAAQQAGLTITAKSLAHSVREMGCEHDILLVEGAGGALVPLNTTESMLDLMRILDFPVIIVADNKLGMINHTLMTIHTLRNNGLQIAGIVMNHTTPSTSDTRAIRANNIETVRAVGEVDILAEIPFGREPEQAIPHITPAVSTLLTSDQATLDLPLDFDRHHVWHPYTSATNPLATVKVKDASECTLRLDNGTELIDGMASWWCAIHGYRHPELDRAAHEQIGRMSHIMFGGLTHDPALELSKTLLSMVPEQLQHVFLADSGSVSVEVALKMALQYMQASGQPHRTRCFTLRGGYHGDTFGAMSVCDPVNGMHHLFSGILPQHIFAPTPDAPFHDDFNPTSLDETRDLLHKHAHEVAAIIVEPIVQGAGGMRFYHPEYLKGLRTLADQYGILLILDEIATGFGRTGKLFGCDWADVTPDIMCVGKALSGGYMTLAATLATSHVAHTISQAGGVLMHGPTFMGNPLACHIANTSLRILQTGNWETQVKNIETWLKRELAPCSQLPDVRDVRVLGAIGVVELTRPVNGDQLQQFFISQGVWIRPFGKLIYIMPPYIISETHIKQLSNAIFNAIQSQVYL